MATEFPPYSKEKTPEGDTGVFGADDRHWGDSIAPLSKQHRGAIVHITCPFSTTYSIKPQQIGY